MNRHHLIAALFGLLHPVMMAQPAAYEVSQWNPGSATFSPLGVIHPYVTTTSVATYYNFTGANPSFTAPAPPLTSNRSHLFLVESAVNGLCVAFVHDQPGDGSGGQAETSWTVAGDPNGMAWLVQDGPPGVGGDVYTGTPGGSSFTACHTWPGVNSDGGVLGSLGGSWILDVVFTNVCPGFATTAGLSSWYAFSCEGIEIPIVLASSRPVRITPISSATLSGTPSTLSVTTGGVQTLSLMGGAAAAGAAYIMAGSSATTPGFPLGCYEIPLAPDAYFIWTLQYSNLPPLTGSVGVLDSTGIATAHFTLPAGSPPALVGLTVHHAFIAIVPGVLLSNTAPVSFVP